MKSVAKSFALLLFTTLLAASLFTTGCEVHARVYDPYYHDYHAWGPEAGYYSQWEHDNHKEHVEFEKRSDADKKAYWDWRHSNPHQ